MAIDLSTKYDATFDGVDFWELNDKWYGKPDSKIAYRVEHIPGSDTNHVIQDGVLAVTFSLAAGGKVASLTALEGKLGESGSLVIRSGTFTALLVEINNKKLAPDTAIDGYQAELVFVV